LRPVLAAMEPMVTYASLLSSDGEWIMPDYRYVVVDQQSRTIIGGPYKWDGVQEWTPSESGTLMLEADALSAGYTYPETGQ
jgi:hypothetical protein